MGTEAVISSASILVVSKLRAGITAYKFGFYASATNLPSWYQTNYTQYSASPNTTTFKQDFVALSAADQSDLTAAIPAAYLGLIPVTFSTSSTYTTNQTNFSRLKNITQDGYTELLNQFATSSHPQAGDIFFTTTTSVALDRVAIHEIGHGLGLTDIESTTLKGGTYDNEKYSIMSYHQRVGAGVDAYTPQVLDIAALQSLDGQGTGGAGTTTYSNWTTDATGHTSTFGALICIWDHDGTDTFDASGTSTGSFIDLRPGHFSSISNNSGVAVSGNSLISSGHENVSIAFGAYIENATGSAANADYIVGNEFSNHLIGGSKGDVLYADSSQLTGTLAGAADYSYVDKTGVHSYAPTAASQTDILDGGGGDDWLYGGAGTNTLNGQDGNDRLYGGSGANTMSGGAGSDRFYPAGKSNAINGGTDTGLTNDGATRENATNQTVGDTLDLSLLAASVTMTGGSNSFKFTGGTIATMTNIERIVGTNYGDAFHADGVVVLLGGSGNDTVYIDSSVKGSAVGIIDLGAGVNTIVVDDSNTNRSIQNGLGLDSELVQIKVSAGSDLIQLTHTANFGSPGANNGDGVRVVSTGLTGGTVTIVHDYTSQFPDQGITTYEPVGAVSLSDISYSVTDQRAGFSGDVFGVLVAHWQNEAVELGNVYRQVHSDGSQTWATQYSPTLDNMSFLIGGHSTGFYDNAPLQSFLLAGGS